MRRVCQMSIIGLAKSSPGMPGALCTVPFGDHALDVRAVGEQGRGLSRHFLQYDQRDRDVGEQRAEWAHGNGWWR